MKKTYLDTLEENLSIKNPIDVDYKQPDNIDESELEFRNVRANVRLQQKKVLLPKDFNKFKSLVKSLKF